MISADVEEEEVREIISASVEVDINSEMEEDDSFVLGSMAAADGWSSSASENRGVTMRVR